MRTHSPPRTIVIRSLYIQNAPKRSDCSICTQMCAHHPNTVDLWLIIRIQCDQQTHRIMMHQCRTSSNATFLCNNTSTALKDRNMFRNSVMKLPLTENWLVLLEKHYTNCIRTEEHRATDDTRLYDRMYQRISTQ
ncbi:unnamed protein product [Albugo candida]|uniref:Uncharacterized protein n=1 Tax=Albugo candida TaxID=65357 RepID=A0A024GMH5_9STRA|nr:unnamed protein product [Albugo candida]|eukprot:CCI47963.1 unnamed protein product [Albugo candida]